jgi:prevent-host-death family protein
VSRCVKAIGIVQAKTKLAEICERVAARHEPVTITKRGKPLVRIEPVENGKQAVWKARAKFLARGNKLPERINLPTRATQPKRPLFAT